MWFEYPTSGEDQLMPPHPIPGTTPPLEPPHPWTPGALNPQTPWIRGREEITGGEIEDYGRAGRWIRLLKVSGSRVEERGIKTPN